MITTLKTYGLLILSGLVSVLALALKISGARSKRLEKANDSLKAQVDHQKDVMVKDKEIELEHDVRTEELRNEIKKNGTSSQLSNPNDW